MDALGRLLAGAPSARATAPSARTTARSARASSQPTTLSPPPREQPLDPREQARSLRRYPRHRASRAARITPAPFARSAAPSPSPSSGSRSSPIPSAARRPPACRRSIGASRRSIRANNRSIRASKLAAYDPIPAAAPAARRGSLPRRSPAPPRPRHRLHRAPAPRHYPPPHWAGRSAGGGSAVRA